MDRFPAKEVDLCSFGAWSVGSVSGMIEMTGIGWILLGLGLLTAVIALLGYLVSRPRIDPYTKHVIEMSTCETCGLVSRCAYEGLVALVYKQEPTATRPQWIARMYLSNTADAQLSLWTRQGMLRDEAYEAFCAALRDESLRAHYHATHCQNYLLAWEYYSWW
jgi:hypothetical protein